MKTPLPEKMLGTVITRLGVNPPIIQMSGTDAKINDIIDYLAELTEVVEGKQTPKMCKVGHCDGMCYCVEEKQTSNLKETLLREMRRASTTDSLSHVFVSINSIEAIINRLL